MSVARVRYRAFELDIESEVALWPGEPGAATRPADVRVTLGEGYRAIERGFELGARRTATLIVDAATIRVTEGRDIEVFPEPDVDTQTLAVCAGGAGLAMACHQRGRLVLHGSCIGIGQRGICVVGASGVGKSTLALALSLRGHRLLSDGMTVLDVGHEGSPIRALSGPATVKLWPDSLAHFGWDAQRTARVTPAFDKRVVELPSTAEGEAVPLDTVIVLRAGDAAMLTRPSPSEALMELVKNAYLVDHLAATSGAALLEGFGAVAGALRVRVMTVPRGFARLDEALHRVEELCAAS